MPTRTIYLSYATDDWLATRGLRDALDAASLAVVARQSEQIAVASRFVACFSPGEDGGVRYERQELLAAIERRRRLGNGERWLIALKLGQCHLPVVPIQWNEVPVIGPSDDWSAVVAQIELRGSTPQMNASVTGESVAAGRDINVTGAELSSGESPEADAHLNVAFRDMVSDRDVNITGLRSTEPRRKER
jgi:hypothetical protein